MHVPERYLLLKNIKIFNKLRVTKLSTNSDWLRLSIFTKTSLQCIGKNRIACNEVMDVANSHWKEWLILHLSEDHGDNANPGNAYEQSEASTDNIEIINKETKIEQKKRKEWNATKSVGLLLTHTSWKSINRGYGPVCEEEKYGQIHRGVVWIRPIRFMNTSDDTSEPVYSTRSVAPSIAVAPTISFLTRIDFGRAVADIEPPTIDTYQNEAGWRCQVLCHSRTIPAA